MAGAVSELRAKFSASIGDFKKGVSGVREEVAGIGKSTDKSMSEANKSIDGFQNSLNKIDGKGLKDIESSASGAGSAIKTMNDKTFKSTMEAEKKLKALNTQFKTISKTAIGAGIVAGGALFAGAIVVTEEYQKALNGVEAATGATKEETAELAEGMKNIYGNGYGANFEEIGLAMTEAKNITGTFGKELEGLTQNSLMLRDTFGYDMAESLRSSDKLMKNFGLTGEQSMELIAEGSRKGLDFAKDLLPTIDEYSVYFQQAGYDASGMFGVFENAKKAGVFNLDYAADAFKEFGIIMTEDSTRASDALDGLGLDGARLREEFGKGGASAQKAMSEVATALDGVKDPVKKNILGVELFGTKFEDIGSKAVVEMLQVNDSIKGTTGALKEIDKVKYNSIGESLIGIKRMLEVEMLEPIQTKVMPMINNLVNSVKQNMPAIKEGFKTAFGIISGAVSKFAPTFESLFTIFKNVGGWVGAVLVVAFSSLASVLAPITNVVTGIVAAFTEWGAFKPILTGLLAGLLAYKTYMFAIQAPMRVMALLTRGWAIAQGILNAVMLLNPIGLIIAAIVGLVAAFVVAYKSSDKFRAIVDALWSSIKNGAMAAFKWLTTNIPLFIESIKNFFIGLGTSIANIWNSITGVVVPIIMNFVNAIKEKISALVKGVMNFLSPLVGFFKETWQNIKLLVLSIVAAFLNLLVGDFKGFKTSLLGIWTAIKNQVVNIVTTLKTMVTNSFNLLKSGAVNIFNGLKNAVINTVTALKNGVINSVKAIKDGIVNGFNTAKTMGSNAINGMKDAIGNAITTIKSKFSGMKDSILSTLRGISLKDIGRNIIQGLLDGISAKVGAVVDKVKSLAKSITGTITKMMGIKSPSRVFREIGDFLGKGLAIGIEKTRGLVEKTTAALAQSATINPETVGVGKLTDEQLGGDDTTGGGGSGGTGYNTNYNAPLMHIENYHQNDDTDVRKISNDLYRLEVDHSRGRGKKTT